jgi:uncharacterized protein (DUF2236 family)
MTMAAESAAGLAELRRVASEGVLLAGGARAILLQVAHPAIARGVVRHSDFAARPVDRLHATLRYVYAVTCGSEADRERVADAVTGVHRHVVGPGYDARDPDLQLWVAATLYDTAVDLYERVFGPLPAARAEEVYRQYAVLGTSLQMSDARWPADRAAFAAYWSTATAELRVGDRARGIAHDLLHPRAASLRPVAPAVRLLTGGLLAPRLRSDYGLAWSPRRQRAFDGLVHAIAVGYPRLPTRLRQLPKSYYLRQVHRSGSAC